MNVQQEIDDFASDKDKPVLKWLFDRYHFESQWRFVASCTFQRYGMLSYQTNRVWYPTTEGRALYEHAHKDAKVTPIKEKKEILAAADRVMELVMQRELWLFGKTKMKEYVSREAIESVLIKELSKMS